MYKTDERGGARPRSHTPKKSGLCSSVLCGAMLLIAPGCTTAMVRAPGGFTIVQPKDTSFDRLTYEQTDANGVHHKITIDKYSSNANQAVLGKQLDLISTLAGSGATLATQAAVKGAP